MQSKETLKYFADYIEQHIGIIYSEVNYFQLENRLEQITKYHGLGTIDDLYRFSQDRGIQGSFQSMLLDLATNNETSFFRDQKVFKSVETFVKEHLLNLKKNETINIWSAACSTGQEPVSIAIMLNEMKEKFNLKFNFKIFASDISSIVLERAKSGVYSQLEVQRGLPAPLMVKYFRKDETDKWHLDSNILRTIEYKKINLKNLSVNLGQFDILFCRNILIYQKIEQKKEIIYQLSKHLAPGGAFILGSGETMIGISQGFDQTTVGESIIYLKKQEQFKAA